MSSADTGDLFKATLTEIANGPKTTGYMATTEALMRRMAEKGATLEQLTGRKFLNRSRRTLEAHCRKFQIAFPDYVPEALRPRDWRKRLRGG